MQRLAGWCYEHRRRVVVLWIIALISTVAISSQVGEAFQQDFSQPGTESQRATDLLKERFPARAGDEGQIVFTVSNPEGVNDPAVQLRMEELFAAVAKVKVVTGVESPYGAEGTNQLAEDGSVAFATVEFTKRSFELTDSTTIEKIKELANDASGDGLRIELGGDMFLEQPALGGEAIGLLAAMFILLVVFGSVLAMGLPILIALFGIGIGAALIALMSHLIPTVDFTTQLAAMIGIGVGIDYALFIVTRYRQGLHDGRDPRTAVVHAIDTSGRAVVFAGCTVVISILGLFLIASEWVYGMALGTALTVALVMMASVTLLPAMLGFAGHTIDKLSLPGRRTREGHTRTSFWFRWSRFVQRRPWPAFVGAMGLLILLAVPLFSIRLGIADAGANPPADTTRQAYDLIAKGFGPGANGPLILAAEYPNGSAGADAPAALDRLADTIRSTPGVATVTAPSQNPAGDAAIIRVTPESSPQAEATTDLVHHLRDVVVPRAMEGTDVNVYVGGQTAFGIDISDHLSDRQPLFIGAVLILSFLLLMAVFRSILVPVKAVIMNLLSIGAAYGVIVAVFQWGWLADVIGVSSTGPISPFVPMMMFAIVFGLSMDYEVFLLSRVREEYDRTHDNGLAVADGLAATARVITAAALIMVAVFGSFMLGDDPTIKLFGLGLSVAIFLDATIVRTVLVPATMELLGDRNWWFPGWLDRIVPQLHVEPPPHPDEELAELVAAEAPERV